MKELFVPKGDNDELGIFRPILDIIRDDRYVSEVKSGINFIHKVKRGRLQKQRVNIYLGEQSVKLTLKTCRAKTRARELRVCVAKLSERF